MGLALPGPDRREFRCGLRREACTCRDGLRQCLWGAVKKVVIADSCAVLANAAFADYATLSGVQLVLGAVFFAFQVYGDFSGYSDMAIGTAKLFGFRLCVNFRTPCFAQSVGESWGRWHISLSTWFRDYVYIPLGGRRCGLARRIVNLLLTFAVSGLWHGANWTFVVWGLVHGLFCVPGAVAAGEPSFADRTAAQRRQFTWERRALHFGTHDIVDPVLVRSFRECLRLCRERDIRVVLIRYPVTAEYAAGVVAGMRLAVDRAYAGAGAWDGGALFIDAFDWNSGDPAYFYDADHMNRRGAAAFGRYLDERLRVAEER